MRLFRKAPISRRGNPSCRQCSARELVRVLVVEAIEERTPASSTGVGDVCRVFPSFNVFIDLLMFHSKSSLYHWLHWWLIPYHFYSISLDSLMFPSISSNKVSIASLMFHLVPALYHWFTEVTFHIITRSFSSLMFHSIPLNPVECHSSYNRFTDISFNIFCISLDLVIFHSWSSLYHWILWWFIQFHSTQSTFIQFINGFTDFSFHISSILLFCFTEFSFYIIIYIIGFPDVPLNTI